MNNFARVALYSSVAVALVGTSFAVRTLTDESGSAAPDLPFGRTGIEVCVSVAPGLQSDMPPGRAVQLIQAATDEVTSSPRAVELEIDKLSRQVSAGCPNGHADPPEGVGEGRATSMRGRVDQPLKVSTLVFVSSDEQSNELGPNGFGRAPYESVCVGDVCSEVTTALFISRSVLESPEALRTAMVVGLGVDPTGGLYPNGHPPELDGATK